jgi:multidrug efflux pump subunit AcrA (membrane-fusion protein)
VAVFAWRLTPSEGLANYIAWVVLSVLGARVFFNFNPLLKLDGYYLLSDWKGVPNLHQRGQDRAKAHLRRALWGAGPPPPDPDGRFLTAYGLASWAFSVVFLGLMLTGLFWYLWSSWGLVALAVVPLGWVTTRGLAAGLAGGEVGAMIRRRLRRTVGWVAGLAAAAAALVWVEFEDRPGGPFQARAVTRAEVRAPVSGLLREVCYDEGERVSSGSVVARIEVPGLEARTGKAEASLREAEARLRLAEVGPRSEEAQVARGQLLVAREDLRYLQDVGRRLTVASPVGGVVTTPRPRDRVGRYVQEGDLICVVEEASALEVEVSVAEQDVARVRPGQPVELRARALPLATLRGRVDRVAPAATRPDPGTAAAAPPRGEAPGTVTVYCRLDGGVPGLRPGMTGHARVSCGPRPAGEVLRERVLRVVRTEFWW